MNPLELLEARERAAVLAECCCGLTPRLKAVIRGRYVEAQTLREVGRELGVTAERVRQLEARAVLVLRRRILASTEARLVLGVPGSRYRHPSARVEKVARAPLELVARRVVEVARCRVVPGPDDARACALYVYAAERASRELGIVLKEEFTLGCRVLDPPPLPSAEVRDAARRLQALLHPEHPAQRELGQISTPPRRPRQFFLFVRGPEEVEFGSADPRVWRYR